MLLGIVAGMVYLWVLSIYGLRQIGQIKGQIGQINPNIYHMYIQCNIRSLLKTKISFFSSIILQIR
jgi:hypothetical protein